MYGQYSYNSAPRQTIAEFSRYRVTANAKVSKPKTCTGHNRFVVEYPSGAKEFWLHSTAVVTLHPNGKVTLRDGGWTSKTTRRAMCQGVKELTGIGVGISGGSHVKHDHCLWGSRDTGFNCPYTFTPKKG